MRNSRLIGGKPKIGIRPIIDGRRGGIRESLEDIRRKAIRTLAVCAVVRLNLPASVICLRQSGLQTLQTLISSGECCQLFVGHDDP